QLLRSKYKADPPDVVVTSDDNALDFALGLRKEIFPHAPIVFCGVNYYHPNRLRGEKNITGIAENFNIPRTFDLILTLHPKLSYIAVVSDSTETGRYNTARLMQVIHNYENEVKFLFLLERTKEELERELRALPPNGVVLNLSFWRDRSGRVLTYQESLSFLAETAPCPIYTLWDFMVNFGTVGGYVADGRMQGKLAAELALQVLWGISADSIPVVTESPNSYYFDYRALERWNIPLDALPEGSVIINRPRETFYQFVLYFWISLAIAGGLAFLAVSFFLQRRELQRMLQEREILLKEIHHRVKNNLQVVSSLLNLQKDTMFDPRDVSYLENCRTRVQSMALIHENLYKSTHLDRIQIEPYCRELFSQMEQIYSLRSQGIYLETQIQDIQLGLNESIPFGLLLVELVSNAIKHGVSKEGGTINVSVRKETSEKKMILEVKDSGRGFPEGFNPYESESLGLQLVFSLVDQLGGQIEWRNEEGLRAIVQFPLPT
ncbi:MAG: ATP-binding protein, partial [Spirochaetes bacterium]|nr:ATP-binding protein [Spirochaetota bacterium]